MNNLFTVSHWTYLWENFNLIQTSTPQWGAQGDHLWQTHHNQLLLNKQMLLIIILSICLFICTEKFCVYFTAKYSTTEMVSRTQTTIYAYLLKDRISFTSKKLAKRVVQECMHHISRLKKKLKQTSEIWNADVQLIFQADNAGTGIIMTELFCDAWDTAWINSSAPHS